MIVANNNILIFYGNGNESFRKLPKSERTVDEESWSLFYKGARGR